MRGQFLGAVALTTLSLGATSFAADMRVKAPVYKAPAAPVAYNWTGCYIGGSAGAVRGKSDFTWSGISEAAGGFAAGAATVLPAAANATLSQTGFTGGGQVGCNYQTGAFVVGLEEDLSWTGLSTSRSATSLGNTNGGPATIVPGLISESWSSRWLSTVRGRAGFAVDRVFVYGTGGAAWARVNYFDQLCFPTAGTPSCNTVGAAQTRLGWVAGGGIEWAFWQNWSVKAEGLYTDLGHTTDTSVGVTTAGATPFPNATITHDHRLTEVIGRVGLNYKLDWTAMP